MRQDNFSNSSILPRRLDVMASLIFAPIELGLLAEGNKLQQAKGALATLNLVKF